MRTFNSWCLRTQRPLEASTIMTKTSLLWALQWNCMHTCTSVTPHNYIRMNFMMHWRESGRRKWMYWEGSRCPLSRWSWKTIVSSGELQLLYMFRCTPLTYARTHTVGGNMLQNSGCSLFYNCQFHDRRWGQYASITLRIIGC